MLSSVGAPAVSNPILAPLAPTPADASSNVPSESTTSASGTDVFSLSQPGSPTSDDGVYQRTSLQLRQRSHVRLTDDGQSHAISHTKLRFRYDFEAADGTQIRIRAQTNLRYSQLTGGDQESQSLKLRATASVSVLQETVSSGVSPLLETPDNSANLKNLISGALDLFRQVTDAATSAFLDSEALDGDRLITGMVEAFNGLSEAISSIFVPPASTPETLPSADTGGALEPPPVTPDDVLPPEPAPIETESPVDVDPTPVPDAPSETPQDVAQPDVPEGEIAENVGEGDTPAVEDGSQGDAPVVEDIATPETGEQGEAVEGGNVGPVPDESTIPDPITEPTTEPTTTEPSRQFAGSVMFKLRLQVIQSLNSLVGVFDSGSSDQPTSHSVLRASAQFSARYNISGPGVIDALSGDNRIDTQV